MKSIRVRSVCASAVGSRVASWVPAVATGPTKPLPENLMLAPLKLMKVGSATLVSDDTLVVGATTFTLTVSLPPPMSTTPTIREPLAASACRLG